MFARLFRKKKPLTDINDLANFFVELISRSKDYQSGPVRIHFITDGIPGKPYCVSDAGDLLPFLRTVLFDAAQNTVSNPETSLRVHRVAEGSTEKILAAIASDIRPARYRFFVITLGKKFLQKETIKEFSSLPEDARRRLTLLHLPLGQENAKTQGSALVSAVRVLLKGEPLAEGEARLRTL
jgi:hypothetical protein